MSSLISLSELLKQNLSLYLLKQVHAQTVRLSLSSHPSLISSLIHRYLPLQCFRSARILFDSYPSSTSPPSLIWNLLIRAHAKTPDSLESIRYFSRMLAVSSYKPDDYTYTFTLTSCSHQTWPGYGQLLHCLTIKDGFESGTYVANATINMYSVFGDLSSARKLFEQMSERDVFTWTTLLCGYAKHGQIDNACEVFDRMPVRNDVSWGVMISGLVSNERHTEALTYFRCLLADAEVNPNEAAIVCALSACAHLGALDFGNWIHTWCEVSSNINTALIDMYAKCGKIDSAITTFNRIQRPNVHNYTSMISGLSIHGFGKQAVELFYRMMDDDVRPNDITLLMVLNGCSHSGLVNEGTEIFNSIETPKIEHYGAYVDLLARAGSIEKALEVVKSMAIEPDIVIWRALLSACRIHRNISLGERVMSNVNSNGDVLLSNLYASLGKWEDVSELRSVMRKKTLNPGCSWVEINGVVHEFRVDEQIHPEIWAVREKVKEMMEKASKVGYVVEVTRVSFDLSEEDKEEAMARHSEKLAVAFALMKTPGGECIRVVKNLRTCEDCHSALKAVSVAYGREIVVRDRCRFHTFKGGVCSCNDYW